MTDYHTPICTTCQVGWDRDENAAANIASKLKEKDRHKKSCQTRKKHASKTRRRNSKNTTRPLKHPLKKTEPTPKAPQNQPKQGKTHHVHHKHTVIKKCEGGVFPVLCAAGQPLPYGGVTVPAVVHAHGSDKKPHDYPTGRHRSNDVCLSSGIVIRLSDNVTYFVEQVDAANVSPNHYKVTYKPETIVPDIEMR